MWYLWIALGVQWILFFGFIANKEHVYSITFKVITSLSISLLWPVSVPFVMWAGKQSKSTKSTKFSKFTKSPVFTGPTIIPFDPNRKLNKGQDYDKPL